MHTTADFIHQIKTRDNLSDYRVAKMLGISRSAMSLHKKGKSKTLSDETAGKIAEILGMDPAYVLMCLNAERAKDPEVKALYKRMGQLVLAAAKKGRRAAAAVLAAILIPYSMSPDIAHAANVATPHFFSSSEYVLCALEIMLLLWSMARYFAHWLLFPSSFRAIGIVGNNDILLDICMRTGSVRGTPYAVITSKNK